jgi:hypothetical protein
LGSIFVVKYLSCEFPSFSIKSPEIFGSVAGQDTVLWLYLRNAEEVVKWSQLIEAMVTG